MAKRDWSALAVEYISGTETLEEFAKRKDIPFSTLAKRSMSESWQDKRKLNGKKTESAALETVAAESADLLAEQNKRDLRGAELVHAKAIDMLELVDSPQGLAAAMTALEKAQKVARLALGANTESSQLTGKNGKDLLPASKTLNISKDATPEQIAALTAALFKTNEEGYDLET